jgi:hypothetical protein
MDIIIAGSIGAAATLIATLLKLRWSCKLEKNKLKKHTVQNEDVYRALQYTLDYLSTDRVVVYEFHNGDIYYSGSSQQKFSNTYELVGDGISSELKHQQNLRVSSFNRFVKPLVDNDYYEFKSLDDVEDVVIRNFFADQGTYSTYCVPIKLLSGKIIGILGVDFVRREKNIPDDHKRFIKNQATIIAGYLKA